MNEKKLSDIANSIHIFRNQKVMLDRDLAELYGVEVKALNQAVKRNKERFPSDFCFRLNFKDLEDYRSQIVTGNPINIRNDIYPTVFTEQGCYALSFVLRSAKAIEMGLFITRAFTYLRRFILENENLMMELKNNDQLSKTFAHFENRIEKDLLVLYKNTSRFEKRIKALELKLEELKKLI